MRRGGLIQQSLHQNVNRSKTLGDVTRKFTVVHTNTSTKPPPRKISSPLMSQSVIYEPSFKLYASVKHDLNLKKDSSSKKDLRKVMAKKRMAKVRMVVRIFIQQLCLRRTAHIAKKNWFDWLCLTALTTTVKKKSPWILKRKRRIIVQLVTSLPSHKARKNGWSEMQSNQQVLDL